MYVFSDSNLSRWLSYSIVHSC